MGGTSGVYPVISREGGEGYSVTLSLQIISPASQSEPNTNFELTQQISTRESEEMSPVSDLSLYLLLQDVSIEFLLREGGEKAELIQN